MDADLTDDQLDDLAEQVADRLPTGRYGDRVILTRRQAMALAGSGLSLAALGFGTGSAAAADGTNDTSVGDVGASGSDVDVYLDQLRDPGGDEVANFDDAGYIDATPREWRFPALGITGDLTDTANSQTVYDESAQEVTADVNNGSVKTDTATVGDRSVPVEIDSVGVSNGNLLIDNIPDYDFYKLEAKVELTNTVQGDELKMEFNKAGSSNNNHIYFRQNGNRSALQDTIPVVTIDDSYGAAAVDFNAEMTPGIDGRPSASFLQLGRESTIEGFADWGGYSQFGDGISAIKLTTDAGFSSDSTMTLFGR